MSKSDDYFKSVLADKKIPVLTLDNKWHQLFNQGAEPDRRIKRLEEKLNDLLKKQGKANTETKEIKKLKRKLMQEIMENAQDASSGNDKAAQKKMDENKRLIDDCNRKIRGYKDELLELPKEIDKVNKELMLVTLEICYDRLKENEQEIEETSRWVTQIRVELKKRLIRKQEKEEANQQLYSYMHDIFGADVINIFDMGYKGMEKES